MSGNQVLSASRITGNAAWWVFVIAALVNRRLSLWDWGWTAYTPLTDGKPRRYADFVLFDPTVQLVGVLVWMAFGVVVIAALVELGIVRRWRAAVSVVIPFVSLGLIAYAFGGLDHTIIWTPTVGLAFVLAAVAIRQVWMWRFAPVTGER